MPTITVNRDALFKRLGKRFSDEEFNDLCFDFGIELDEVTTEKQMKAKEAGATIDQKSDQNDEEIVYKIEISANRYDLLCLEGLARALNVFLQNCKIPKYSLQSTKEINDLIVLPNTQKIRPFVVGAILRGIKFSKLSYDSFIELQDKLHQNICRKRTLVAIGTHDLDTIKGPFYYDAKQPEQIEFIPLKQTKKFNSKELLDYYSKNDEHLRPYVPIIKDSPVYPVIYDSNNVVLSLPPIINGEHSKITLNTTNILIECTATDIHKASIVLDTIVCMFAEYCSNPFEIEPIQVTQMNGSKEIFPKLKYRHESISLDYIKSNLGIDLDSDETCKVLQRMCLESKKLSDKKVDVLIPPTRQDILHACDILEDIGIGYGYNRIPIRLPQSFTIAEQFFLNKLTDQLRDEIARCGFTEIFTFSLCARDDIGEKMRNKESLERAVKIANPKTLDFQVARTSLIPGILKTIASNKKMPLPLKLFEISDIVLKDDKRDVGARNERYLSTVYYHKHSGFEIIHGLLDRIMQVLEHSVRSENNPNGYFIQAKDDPRFLKNRCAEIFLQNKPIGIMGILHPEVIQNFELNQACSALEISIQNIFTNA
ncbi:phenylalanine-tRNA ligase beta subunit-like protein [Sarcoptes scabiei]|uniref:Phenylalanine--tRNA ligase beta subunit n=1 Tax=Sarcoptes scabiei TaxID=52283 RepID=A0A132A9T8_SARSC|nr:phenylalanine-tRNA ligase beta subunit-like protein [Sarcoptes scabiei]